MPTVIGPSEPPSIVVMPRRDGVLAQARGVEMHVHVDGAGGGDQPFAVAHRGGRGDDQARVDAVHDGGIAGLADADDAAVLDAEVALDDAEHRVDHARRCRAACRARPRALVTPAARPDAVAQGLAAAVQAFVAVDRVVLLDHGDQRGVAEPHAVADGRAVELRVVAAGHAGHGLRSLEAGRAGARASAASRAAIAVGRRPRSAH